MRLISAVSGVRLPAPPPLIILSPFLRRWGNMKKLITLASVGVFLLSLQGASLAQDKVPATPATPAIPATPAGPPTAATPSITPETPAAPEVKKAQKTKKTKKKEPRKRPRRPRRLRRLRRLRHPKSKNKNPVAGAPVRGSIQAGSNPGPGLLAQLQEEGS